MNTLVRLGKIQLVISLLVVIAGFIVHSGWMVFCGFLAVALSIGTLALAKLGG